MVDVKKSILAGIAALLLLTAVLAVLHLTTRTPDVKGEILVNGAGVNIDGLQFTDVSGTIVNGRGEETQIKAPGIPLSELCGDDFEEAEVTASDEYRAVVYAHEKDRAYLILNDDGTVQLVVFGDDNQKRDVKNVVRIDTK